MNTADLIYLIFQVACFGYAGFMFFMLGKNSHEKYQNMRQHIQQTFKAPDSDGLFYFFAVVLFLNVLRVIYQHM